MKNKLINATFLLGLSLIYSGVASAAAYVESRSSSSARNSYSEQANESMQNTSLETMQRVEYLQREMQELRGKVEEQSYQMQQMQEQQKKLYMDLDKRLREGSATTAKAAPTNLDIGEPAAANPVKAQNTIDLNAASKFVHDQPEPVVTTAAVNASNSVNDEKAYQEGYRLLQNKDYDGAIRVFNGMLAQSPQGKYAPNAQYWLGEIYLTKGVLDKAADAFSVVYKQYPQHPKAADSLLKLGYVEYNKGQWKRCQELLNMVKTQYPGTTSAQLADSRIQRLQQEDH